MRWCLIGLCPDTTSTSEGCLRWHWTASVIILTIVQFICTTSMIRSTSTTDGLAGIIHLSVVSFTRIDIVHLTNWDASLYNLLIDRVILGTTNLIDENQVIKYSLTLTSHFKTRSQTRRKAMQSVTNIPRWWNLGDLSSPIDVIEQQWRSDICWRSVRNRFVQHRVIRIMIAVTWIDSTVNKPWYLRWTRNTWKFQHSFSRSVQHEVLFWSRYSHNGVRKD